MIDYDLNQLTAYGINIQTGMQYTGGREKYISALQRYYKSHDANKEKVETFLAAKDMENYSIIVHALKSNSRMIGEDALGGLFEELELAAKAGDTDLVMARTSAAIKRYDAVVEYLKPLGEMEQVKASAEISGEEAKKTAEELLAALDDFDDERSAELARKLSGYPFRITQKTKLKEAIEHIGNFMYDEAAGIIQEIMQAIE